MKWIKFSDQLPTTDELKSMEWVDVENYEGLYCISRSGLVKSKRCFIKPYIGNGYPCVSLCKNNKKTTYRIHRLVANAYIPNPLNKKCVNHIDGDKSNNNSSNLEWCNYKENNCHMFETGLALKKGRYRYITHNKRLNKWVVTVTNNENRVYLGIYDSQSIALKIRDNYIKESDMRPIMEYKKKEQYV